MGWGPCLAALPSRSVGSQLVKHSAEMIQNPLV